MSNKNSHQLYLNFSKVRDVKNPERGHSTDAGIDFFVPNDFTEVILKPGENVLIPSGIKTKFNDGYALIAKNKSGVAAKKSLIVGAQVIDSSYQGEIHIDLHNVGLNEQKITPGMKATQFIFQKIELSQPIEVPLDELYEAESDRGEGGFGSTGEK